MSHTKIPTCLIMVALLYPNFSAMSLGQNTRKPNAEIHGGKTLDQWITQAKQARKLDDRHDALQTLRNLGLSHDRVKTLRAFTELLSDKVPTVQSLAAVGLRKAGKPTDPKAAAKLVEIISKDLSGVKLPRGKIGEVGGEFGLVMRAIGALSIIGEEKHVPALERVSANKKIDPLIRQTAKSAARQIMVNARKAKAD